MINSFADWPQCKVKNNFHFFFLLLRCRPLSFIAPNSHFSSYLDAYLVDVQFSHL